MKHFSTEDQKLILKIWQIGQSDNAVLTNIFEDVLFGKGIAFDLTQGAILYEYEKYKGDISTLMAVQKVIIQRALIIKYLEENNYIYIINDGNSSENFPTIGDTRIANPVSQILPTDIADIVRRTLYRIYADNSLLDFIHLEYKTPDDIVIEEARNQTEEARKQTEEARKQTKAAQEQTDEAKEQTSTALKALKYSILACVISFAVPFILSKSSHQEEKHAEVINTINSVNSSLINGTEQVSAHIDSVNASEIYQIQQNDSIINVLNKNMAIQGKQK